MHLKISSVQWWPFCPGEELTYDNPVLSPTRGGHVEAIVYNGYSCKTFDKMGRFALYLPLLYVKTILFLPKTYRT